MELPRNRLKRALAEGRSQIGLWSQLASPIATEIVAGSGFDFLVLDTEHAPNEIPAVHAQLQAMESGTATAVVRPMWNDPVNIKRILDLGVQSLLVPWVQTAEEAHRAVAATRFSPEGIRGGASSTRANRYGRLKEYFQQIHQELFLLVQLETRLALGNLEAIAAVDGIDGLFIGPSDLAADLGHIGNPGHPEVRSTIDNAIARIRKAGKVGGILAPIEADARHWLEAGFTFVAVGSDVSVLARQTEALVAKFRQ